MKTHLRLSRTELLHSDHVKVLLIMENKVDAHLQDHIHTQEIYVNVHQNIAGSKLKGFTLCFILVYDRYKTKIKKYDFVYINEYMSDELKLIFLIILSFTGPSLKLCNMYIISSLFATVLFATVLKCSCTSETIFIKTNNSSDHECPAEPCLTLQEFVAYHGIVKSNTVLKFQPGKHVLTFAISRYIYIINVFNVTLTGVSDR